MSGSTKEVIYKASHSHRVFKGRARVVKLGGDFSVGREKGRKTEITLLSTSIGASCAEVVGGPSPGAVPVVGFRGGAALGPSPLSAMRSLFQMDGYRPAARIGYTQACEDEILRSLVAWVGGPGKKNKIVEFQGDAGKVTVLFLALD